MASPGHDPSDDYKPQPSKNIGLIVGGGDDGSDGDEEMVDVRTLSLAGDGEMPPTIFLDDDVIEQRVFAPLDPPAAVSENEPVAGSSNSDMENFVRDFFATHESRRLFQPVEDPNFIDEIFAEKEPKIIGDYLFGGVIGEGSYGKVKEVLHTKKLVRRAIKIIKGKRLRKIPGGEANVQHEIEVLRGLKHPNVVEQLEVFKVEEKDKLYIVMEFCVCSLQQMLDNCPERRLPEFQVHLYFTQLIDGLDYLHSKRIIHKDIKPGNLVLSLDGRVKICDMGVAEMLEGEDPNDDWFTLSQGTPKFQPPEIVSGTQRKFRGRPVDIWAAGVTLYNLVSGAYPFDGDVIMKLFDSIVNSPLQMPKEVQLSEDLALLLTGVLEKCPERRWGSQEVRLCNWFRRSHAIDKSKIVTVPEVRGVPAHRPLSVLNALEQLYGTFDEEGAGKDGVVDGGDTAVRVMASGDRLEEAPTDAAQAPENTPPSDESRLQSATTGATKTKPSRFLLFFRRKNLPNFIQRLLS